MLQNTLALSWANILSTIVGGLKNTTKEGKDVAPNLANASAP